MPMPFVPDPFQAQSAATPQGPRQRRPDSNPRVVDVVPHPHQDELRLLPTGWCMSPTGKNCTRRLARCAASGRTGPRAWSAQASRASLGDCTVVASIQSLWRPDRLARYRPEDWPLMVMDEAHRAVAESYLTVLRHFRFLSQN